MSNNDHLKELLNAIGVLAETSLLFYRAVIQAGASEDEAKFLTQALIRASMTSNPTQESEGEMKVTLDIPDGIVCGFFNGVEITSEGMSLVSYQLGSDDLTDGKTTKLPREKEK